jgi:hypothetical protein
MTDPELDDQDRALRAEADALLRRYGILEIFGAYGRPYLSGSYDLQLMTWRDLDVYLEMEPLEYGRFLEMVARLGRALEPRKLSLTDHVRFPATEPVVGLYCGIQTGVLAQGGWKIDVWGVTPATCAEKLRHCDAIRERLTAETREAILRIKNEVCRMKGYRDTMTSQQVYEAVLERGVGSVEEFVRGIGDRG